MEMNLPVFLAVFIGLVLVFLFSGLPVAVALGALGVILIYVLIGGMIPEQIAYTSWNAIASFTLTAVPLYILMGAIFNYSGLARRIYTAISPLMMRLLPGGLLHANVVAGALFAAATGSGVASTSTIGLVAFTEMERRGYHRGISTGSVAAAGTLGIIIPPSIPLIIYGAMTGNSIGKLFIGGVIPGIILAAAFITYIAIRLSLQPHMGPPREPIPLKACLVKSLSAWPMLMLILSVLGSIYFGVATPTEAAAMGCAGALVIAGGFRMLNWQVIKDITFETARASSMILFIIASAKLLGLAIALLRVPDQIMAVITSAGLGDYFVLLGLYVMYMVMGMFMESLSMLIMTIPITYPVLVFAGFDPIWGGIAIVMLLELATLTPPVGFHLFVVQGLRPNYKFSEIAMGALPFCIVVILVLAIVTAFPQLVTFLPQTMISR